jgi:hypothetical protein
MDSRVMASLLAEVATRESPAKLRGELREEIAAVHGDFKG